MNRSVCRRGGEGRGGEEGRGGGGEGRGGEEEKGMGRCLQKYVK